MSDTPLMTKIECYEGDNENGVVYIDIHTPIVEYGENGADDAFGKKQYWGRAVIMFKGQQNVIKFEIEADCLKDAVDLYDKRCEETVAEMQTQAQQSIVVPNGDSKGA